MRLSLARWPIQRHPTGCRRAMSWCRRLLGLACRHCPLTSLAGSPKAGSPLTAVLPLRRGLTPLLVAASRSPTALVSTSTPPAASRRRRLPACWPMPGSVLTERPLSMSVCAVRRRDPDLAGRVRMTGATLGDAAGRFVVTGASATIDLAGDRLRLVSLDGRTGKKGPRVRVGHGQPFSTFRQQPGDQGARRLLCRWYAGQCALQRRSDCYRAHWPSRR